MARVTQKLIQGTGVSLLILATLYFGELLFNLDNPHFNDADAIELIVKSAMSFLLLGGALVAFSVFYPEAKKTTKVLGATALLTLATLLGYAIGVESFTRCLSSCNTFEMHWIVNVVGVIIFALSIAGIISVLMQFLKSAEVS